MTAAQVQDLCNFAVSIIEVSMLPTIVFEEENGASYYLCPNESVLPPLTEEITEVSGCVPCAFITQTLQTYYLENGLNAPQPTLNTLYGVTPELAELNIDFETYSTICGFSVNFEDQYTALIHWTNPNSTTSYFCLGTFTKQPETGNSDYRYWFNGKERSDEVYGKGNLNTALFWEYDTRLGRRWNLEPVTKPWITSYHAFNNKPITFIDPNGDNANPIIDDETGDLLGTDEKGIQGEAIIMNKSEFKQGMKHSDALKKGTLASNVDLGKYKKGVIINTFKTINSLPSRPDWDGILTKKEADDWWNYGEGKPLFVDESKIELNGLDTDDFDNKVGSTLSENFLFSAPGSATAEVYGRLDLRLITADGVIKIRYQTQLKGVNGLVMDQYDFTYNDGEYIRNAATWFGKPSGNGTKFSILSYGTAKIPKSSWGWTPKK